MVARFECHDNQPHKVETNLPSVRSDAIDDHHFVRESLPTLPCEHNVVIDADFKDTFLALDEFGVCIEFTFDGGRQTGGLRKIISLDAVLNRNVQRMLLVR